MATTESTALIPFAPRNFGTTTEIAPKRRCKGNRTAQARRYYYKHTQGIRQQIVEKLGGKCVQCGFADKRALQIDHIHNGGRQHKLRKGSDYYKDILRTMESGAYQVLCANCNQIKRHEHLRESSLEHML